MKHRRLHDSTRERGVHRVLSSKPSRRGSQAELLIVDNEHGTPTGELLADLMEEVGCGWYQVLALPSLLGITIVECGQIQVISGIAHGLKFEWGLTPIEKAWIPTLAFCGLAIGTVLSGILSDSFGRKKIIITAYISTAATGMALSFSETFGAFACFVMCNGVACGIGVAAAMVMIAEICPSSIRAVAFVLPLFAQSMGEMFAVGMVDVFMPDLVHGNWRAVVLCVALPSYALLIMSGMFLRESPYWLVSKGRVFEARSEILKIAEINGTLHKVEFLATTLEERDTSSGSSGQANKSEDLVSALQKCFSSLDFIIMTFGFCFLCFVGQLLTFGMSYFWPYMLQYVSFSNALFAPATSLGLIRSFGIPAAIILLPIMRSSYGHRWVIFFSGLVEAVTLYGCMVTLSSNSGSTQLVLLAGTSLAFALFFYYAAQTFMAESFPTTVRAFMVSVCLTHGRAGALMAPHMIESLGFRGFLALTIGLTFAAAPMVTTMTETKGKQLEDFFDEDACKRKDRRPGKQRSELSFSENTPLLDEPSSNEESCHSGSESASAQDLPNHTMGDTGGS